MNREEQLDRLIEACQQGEDDAVEASSEVMIRLALAKMLTQYLEMSIPQTVTERIERRLRLHIQQHTRNAAYSPAPAQPAARSHGPRRLLKPLLSAAAVLVLLCAGTLTAAAHTLPGDPLYGMKQAENQFTLIFANSPSARAEDLISQIQSALNDLEAVVTDGRAPGVIQQALSAVITQTTSARASVTTVPAGSLRQKIQQDLASVLDTENQTLRALLNRVNWSLRVALTRQLGAIGQAVPSIEQVSVSQQNNATLMVTITGRNVAPQARLVINGRPQGILSQQTATQFVGMMSQSDWHDDTQVIGVLNPDGTATQIRAGFQVNDDQQHQRGEDDHGGRGGKGTSTPTPGDDHDGSGKGSSGGRGPR